MISSPLYYHQAAIHYSCNHFFRGVSSQAAVPIVSLMISRGLCYNLLHRRAISSVCTTRGGSNNYHHRHQYNYYSKQKSQRVFLEIALFSSALYGSTVVNPFSDATNETTALCSSSSSSNSSDDDEDFISKVKAKINTQSISELSSSLPSSLPTNMDDLLITIGTQTQIALNSGIPTNLSYGFFAGYLSGFALKKIGRVASLSLGVGFVILQTLAYQGYIDVNHDKLAKEVERVLDRNGDGVVDGEDLRSVVEELRGVVGFGIEGNKEGEGQIKAIAGGGGFGMGFLGGLRSG